ncbi:MAG: tetratricopeptide repeat protein, partial [Candidatus Obscuribacterales bacterium]|nr:tetratricopeptide repeat protein [Candidatus Obscuribacterales bacterium]
ENKQLKTDQINSFLRIAQFKSRREQLSQAEPMLRTCIAKLNAIGQKQSPLMLASVYGLGYVLNRQGKHNEAEPYIKEALSIAAQQNIKNEICYYCHFILWEIYCNNLEFQKAKQEASMLLDKNAIQFESTGYGALASTYMKLKEFDEAQKLLTEALQHYQKLHRIPDTAYIEATFAQLYLEKNMYETAIEHADKAIELCKLAGIHCHKSDLAGAYYSKGKALFYLNRKAPAAECLKTSLEMFKSLDFQFVKEEKEIVDILRKLPKTATDTNLSK